MILSAGPPLGTPLGPPPPPAITKHDPVWVVQRAWSVFRLPRLQELIGLTIAELHSLPAVEVLGHDLPSPAGSTCDPVAEALKACCEELRDAAGMADAPAERASHCEMVRGYIEQQPLAWSEAFSEALAKYREAAAKALQTTFSRATATVM